MEEVCRVCLNKSRSNIHIFDNRQRSKVPIASMIAQWIGCTVEKGDSLPEYICQPCFKSAQTAPRSRQSREEGFNVNEKNIEWGEVYRITDIQERSSYLVQVKAEASEDMENYEFQVKNEPIVDALFRQEADSDTDQGINEEFDEDLLEKDHRVDNIDVFQYRTTAKKRPFQCPDCPKSFAFPSDIKRHIRSHERKRMKLSRTEEKPYTCEHCLKRFARKDHFNEHVRTHIVERPYICSQCHKSFKTNAYLKRHVRLHLEERPHKCFLCGMAFMTTSDHKRHNRTHSSDRPYKCSDCPKTFQSETDLKRHSWSHMGELPYSCPKCPKSYLHVTSLIMHMDVHKKKPPTCPTARCAF
ncbi:hypothetical protein KR038_006280 [Drosophila bunnanda]|nr:hypothetical protein KR038_006280 [Drosophila bunnanda]